MWAVLWQLLTGDVPGRLFAVIDKKIDSETDREKLKADVVQTWLQNRMILPWWVDLCLIGPLAIWWGSVCFYSIFWHAAGPFPQDWDIAALPAPLDAWAGWIFLSRFGAGLVQGFTRS